MSTELIYRELPEDKSPVLCRLFQAAAIDTWERIRFSRHTPGLRIHETTITQNLVYELNLLKLHLHIQNLKIYESQSEPTNGNDLELEIQQKDGRYKYWIQSKILYHSMRRICGQSSHPPL